MSANGSVPLSVSWNVSLTGGQGPFTTNVTLPNGTVFYGATGATTFTVPAMYYVSFSISGPGCGEGSDFLVDAWGSGGPNPVSFSLSATSGNVPLVVNASINISGGPTNPGIWWDTPNGQYWDGTSVQSIFYMPGDQSLGLCVYYSGSLNYSQAPFWCGHSPWIHVQGVQYFLSLQSAPTNGTSPLSVTSWVNLSHQPQIPNGTYLAVGVQGISPPISVNYSSNPPSSGNVSQYGASYSATLSPANTTFQCSLSNAYDVTLAAFITVSLNHWNSSRGFVMFGQQVLPINVAGGANSGPPPFPYASILVSPSSGPAPLNATIQLSAEGGTPPYNITMVVLGPLSQSGYPTNATTTSYSNVTAWNGSQLGLNRTFTQPGWYWIIADVSDSGGQPAYAGGAAAQLDVRNGSATGAPPPLAATGTIDPPSANHPSTAGFAATVEGGTPPYTVQWDFGDGALGSSAIGQTVYHTYRPGIFVPRLTVTDGGGNSVTKVLPPITATGTGTQLSIVPMPWYSAYLPAIIVGVLGTASVVIGNWLLRQRRLRLEGEALLDARENQLTRLDSRRGYP